MREDHPLAYAASSLEDMSQTVRECRKTTRNAEAVAESSKKVLATTEYQVGSLVSQYERIVI